MTTPHQKMAGLLLGQPVDQWIRDKRAEGTTWRAITRLLRERTGGQIDITHETVRAWAREDAKKAS